MGSRVRCGVLGDPIAHSLSPVLHRAAYAAWGLDWEYDAHRVPAGGLGAFVDGLGPEWRGLSVTAPLKREAAERADVVSPAGGDGRRRQHPGARRRSMARRQHRHPGRRGGAAGALDVPEIPAATVLGGGATAASVGLALAGLGARTHPPARARPRPGGRCRRRPRASSRAPGRRGRLAARRAWRVRSSCRPSPPPPRPPTWSPAVPAHAARLRGRLPPLADPAGRRPCCRGGERPGAGDRPRPARPPGRPPVRAVHRPPRLPRRHALRPPLSLRRSTRSRSADS